MREDRPWGRAQAPELLSCNRGRELGRTQQAPVFKPGWTEVGLFCLAFYVGNPLLRGKGGTSEEPGRGRRCRVDNWSCVGHCLYPARGETLERPGWRAESQEEAEHHRPGLAGGGGVLGEESLPCDAHRQEGTPAVSPLNARPYKAPNRQIV